MLWCKPSKPAKWAVALCCAVPCRVACCAVLSRAVLCWCRGFRRLGGCRGTSFIRTQRLSGGFSGDCWLLLGCVHVCQGAGVRRQAGLVPCEASCALLCSTRRGWIGRTTNPASPWICGGGGWGCRLSLSQCQSGRSVPWHCNAAAMPVDPAVSAGESWACCRICRGWLDKGE